MRHRLTRPPQPTTILSHMKRLLYLTVLLSTSAFLGAQSFEWNTSNPTPAAAHPKEVQTTEVLTNDYSTPERERGMAGVYAPSAQGQQTAYGEIYNADELTGSHAALPLGTLLRVTNTENGRTVTVRVTDKGQACTDCLVTLSERAAQQLGIRERGAVSLERAGFSNWNPVPPTVEDATPASYTPATQTTQVAAFDQDAIARPAAAPVVVAPPSPTVPGAQQAARGGDAELTPTTAGATGAPAPGTYAVQLAAYNNETYAQRRVEELEQQGIADVYFRAVIKPSGEVINRVYTGTFVNVTEAQAAAKALQDKYDIAGIVAKM